MKVVILAGGKGTRLRPLTNDVPKPLLKVANRPILEWIIVHLKNNGLSDIIISVGYKGNLIKKYFGNGEKFGVDIAYAVETKRLGTAGPLSIVKRNFSVKEPVVVMNGDILTRLDFRKLISFHKSNKADMTIGSIQKMFRIKYGTLKLKDGMVFGVEEKPVVDFNISAGIYVLNPNVFNIIPNGFFDMPTLIEKAVRQKKKVFAYEIKESWKAIDRLVDYEDVSLHGDKYIKQN